MSTNYVPQLTNEAANVKATGKLVKNGYRFTPAGNNQAVVNATLSFRRSWGKKENGQPVMENGKQVFEDKTAYVQFSLWGDAAERFNANIVKSGGTDQRDVRIEAQYSMADMTNRIWGDAGDKVSVTFRASSLTIIGNFPFGNAVSQEDSQTAMPVPQDDIEFN